MKCIVTAGPTYEELDEVRRLTNFSTGALGSELADFLVDHGHEVELLLGHYAAREIRSRAQSIQEFTTSTNLMRRLQGLVSDGVGAVFHAAAVSDFTFGKFWQKGPGRDLVEIKSRKISTRHGLVLAELTATPKIIGHLRQWFPGARLVGWKYEVDGDQGQAIALAEQQLQENSTDACVANGPAYGPGFGLVRGRGRCLHLSDKNALFHALDNLIKQGK
jgi:phosphopantothenoylcysteine decarboxylase/phosphopantothenate--cysteine ligase